MSSQRVAADDSHKEIRPADVNGIISDTNVSGKNYESPSGDWTDDLPSSDHVNLFRGMDWTKTILGAPRQWSTELRFMTNMVFADSRGACIYW